MIMSIEEKMEADARSIYVGNVCTRALVRVWGSSYFGELFDRRFERNISRIGGGFGKLKEAWEEVKDNSDQQRRSGVGKKKD